MGDAEATLAGTSRMWKNAWPERKRRLQRTLFPEAETYAQEEPKPHANRRNLPGVTGLQTPHEAESKLVALRGFEPRFDG